MGKSAAAGLLAQRGCTIIDTDQLAREVVEPGQPALEEIQKTFGADLIGEDGHLRRDALARLVFADEARRRELEDILHPRIRELWRTQVEAARARGESLCVLVIPLLFEAQSEKEFDSIVCVACSAQTQRQRLRTRGWSDQEIVRRLQAQMPAEKKMLLADYVLWNEGELSLLSEQIDRAFPFAKLRTGAFG